MADETIHACKMCELIEACEQGSPRSAFCAAFALGVQCMRFEYLCGDCLVHLASALQDIAGVVYVDEGLAMTTNEIGYA